MKNHYPLFFTKICIWIRTKKRYNDNVVEQMEEAQKNALGIQTLPCLKLYNVFNIAQTNGLDPEFYHVEPVSPLQDWEKDEAAENLILSTNTNIEFRKGNRACYMPVQDKIILPLRSQFNGQSAFYNVALHELGHWTGGQKRLNRPFGKFGDQAYAREEIVAELFSAFTCASLGFSKTITNNAAYIKSWLSILRDDQKAIFKTSAQAQKSRRFCFFFS